MIRTWSSRLGAVALALLILGGGSGLPVLDALLHHLRVGKAVAESQLLDPSTSAAHAERCTLGTALPALVVSTGSSAIGLATTAPAAAAAVRPVDRVSTHFQSCDARPRAPPVTPV